MLFVTFCLLAILGLMIYIVVANRGNPRGRFYW